MRQPCTTIKFSSQLKFPLSGLMACTAISRVLAARVLRMNDHEFFDLFSVKEDSNHDLAVTTLESCLEAGVQLKKCISPGIFGGIKKSAYENDAKIIKELSENIAGVKDVIQVENTQPIGTSFKNIDELGGSIQELYKKFYGICATNIPDKLCFIATANNHTTIFFSKTNPANEQRYFISIDSFANLTNGELQIYENFDSLAYSLIAKWENTTDEVADITVVHLKPEFSPREDSKQAFQQ
jgi:hypothetical protein